MMTQDARRVKKQEIEDAISNLRGVQELLHVALDDEAGAMLAKEIEDLTTIWKDLFQKTHDTKLHTL